MTSAIDPTKPTAGEALTADVRQNFATAASEITDAQNRLSTAEGTLTTVQAQAGVIGGSWTYRQLPNWFVAPYSMIGFDNDDLTQATNFKASQHDSNGVDFSYMFGNLQPGDRVLIRETDQVTGTVYSGVRATIAASPPTIDGNGFWLFPIQPGSAVPYGPAPPGTGQPCSVYFTYF